jgi:hypothetical protein
MKKCIIVQGQINHKKELMSCYLNSPIDIIFSTWLGEEDKLPLDSICIFNKKPSCAGIQNLILQYQTTINGLKYAHKNGYDFAIKIRSDMMPMNINKFIELFYKNINLFYWHNYQHGYITDYFMGGEINKMIDLWDLDLNQSYLYPEQAITKNFFSKHLNKNYQFIGPSIVKDNDIFWIKNNIYLSSYSNDSLFTTQIPNEI